jgi:hypothetical protein
MGVDLSSSALGGESMIMIKRLRFDDNPSATLAYQGSRAKTAVAAALMLGVSLILILKIHRGDLYAPEDNFICGVGAVFFALGGLFFLFQMIRALPTLVLSGTGFELSNGLVRNQYLWKECWNLHVSLLGVSFRRRRYWDGLILNLFKTETEELWSTLTCWQAEHGGDSA